MNDDAMSAIMQEAQTKMWISELDAKDEHGKPNWPMRRLAGEKVCELFGIKDALQAVSLGGELRVPPPWPEVAIVPVGGGPGFLRCEVRTLHANEIKSAAVRIAVKRTKDHEQQIGEAMEIGKAKLRRMVGSTKGDRKR